MNMMIHTVHTVKYDQIVIMLWIDKLIFVYNDVGKANLLLSGGCFGLARIFYISKK